MKRLFRSALGAAGLEVRLRRNVASARAAEKKIQALEPWLRLRRYSANTILDIGANDGYSVTLFREIFPDATILSFEPLEDCFRKVEAVLAQSPPGKAFHCALGDTDGSSVIYRSESSPSSSLLPMDELHRVEFPHTAKATEEQICVRRLDGMTGELQIQNPLLVKIDVQGFEDRVIRGGSETLRTAAAIVVELSSYSLYCGQANFSAVNAQLESLGFAFRGAVDQMYSPKDGRILQFDGLFENTRLC